MPNGESKATPDDVVQQTAIAIKDDETPAKAHISNYWVRNMVFDQTQLAYTPIEDPLASHKNGWRCPPYWSLLRCWRRHSMSEILSKSNPLTLLVGTPAHEYHLWAPGWQFQQLLHPRKRCDRSRIQILCQKECVCRRLDLPRTC